MQQASVPTASERPTAPASPHLQRPAAASAQQQAGGTVAHPCLVLLRLKAHSPTQIDESKLAFVESFVSFCSWKAVNIDIAVSFCLFSILFGLFGSTSGKIPAEYGSSQKRSEEAEIVFVFVTGRKYRFCFCIFGSRFRFRKPKSR
jgi:hypothetical protein